MLPFLTIVQNEHFWDKDALAVLKDMDDGAHVPGSGFGAESAAHRWSRHADGREQEGSRACGWPTGLSHGPLRHPQISFNEASGEEPRSPAGMSCESTLEGQNGSTWAVVKCHSEGAKGHVNQGGVLQPRP